MRSQAEIALATDRDEARKALAIALSIGTNLQARLDRARELVTALAPSATRERLLRALDGAE